MDTHGHYLGSPRFPFGGWVALDPDPRMPSRIITAPVGSGGPAHSIGGTWNVADKQAGREYPSSAMGDHLPVPSVPIRLSQVSYEPVCVRQGRTGQACTPRDSHRVLTPLGGSIPALSQDNCEPFSVRRSQAGLPARSAIHIRGSSRWGADIHLPVSSVTIGLSRTCPREGLPTTKRGRHRPGTPPEAKP